MGGRNIFQSMSTYQSPAALRLRFPTLIHCSLYPPKSFPNSFTLSAQILAEDCKYPCVPLYLWARISLWFPHRAIGLSPISPPPAPLPPTPVSKRNNGQEWFLWSLWFCLAVRGFTGPVQQPVVLPVLSNSKCPFGTV